MDVLTALQSDGILALPSKESSKIVEIGATGSDVSGMLHDAGIPAAIDGNTASTLEIPQGIDVVVAKSALQGLETEAAKELATKILAVTNINGFFVADFTTKLHQEVVENSLITKEGTKEVERFDLVNSGKLKDVSFSVWKKVVSDADGERFQKFLDNSQYTREGILRYEQIFGAGYVSTGGPVTTKEFVSKLGLKEGQRVLDVGCGIGGGDFYMAEEYGVSVLGIDLSSNMIDIAMERIAEQKNLKEDQVKFVIADVTMQEYEPESFDLIYSRDVLLHISDKLALFKKCLTWLKPGGKIFISDYCCGDGEWSPDYKAYVAQRRYSLYTPKAYGKLLEEAGFKNVDAKDATDMFVDVLKTEIKKTEAEKPNFVKLHGQHNYDYIINGWKSKVKRCGDGDQKWGTFYGEK